LAIDAAVRFVAVGDVMVDVVCPEPPASSTRIHGDVVIHAGGSAVNAAVAAAAAGAAATVIGRVGGDHAGDLVAAEIAELGVEAHLTRDEDLATGVAVALDGDAGVRVVANRGANSRLKPGDIPDAVEGDALFVSGFALFQTGSAEAAQAALRRFGGAWAGVDVGSPSLAAKAADADIRVAAGRGTVLLATADEAGAMTGAAPEEAARRLAAQFSVACVKLGRDGAVAASGDRLERRAAEPVVRRSPFGAGDAFGAMLLVALAAGADLGRALELACAAGARSASGAPRNAASGAA
jgi:sugar/nucleoside kinase (ribokinase family)